MSRSGGWQGLRERTSVYPCPRRGLPGPRARARPYCPRSVPRGGLAGPPVGARPCCPRHVPLGGLAGPPGAHLCLSLPAQGDARAARESSPLLPQAWPARGAGKVARKLAPTAQALSRAGAGKDVASRALAPAATGLFLAGSWQGPACARPNAQGPQALRPKCLGHARVFRL
ncbi:hypothetical protein OIU76_019896 [Salix suchowensis]|uniref:Uncharacterized protein n=1 Tax=Salix suchowensis TaxID=1278906 RepID=A0ABQ8ZKM6_9ROSI|nr:hypothetical protein OIU76_019896 [Salix suchowensis]KAJ6302274.1 hypothetical protein OIU77_016375 [Salix suchowensis]